MIGAEGIEEAFMLLREIAPIMRREHDKADGYFSTKQVERVEALLQRMGKIMSEDDTLTQKCRHDNAGSSSQGDYWYCDECGIKVEWIDEGMGAGGFWSPVSPAPAQERLERYWRQIAERWRCGCGVRGWDEHGDAWHAVRCAL